MNRDHLTDPIEIAILVVGLEVAAVDPGLGWASIVDALLGHADEDVERGIGGPHQTGNGGKREAPVEPNSCLAGHLRCFMNERRPETPTLSSRGISQPDRKRVGEGRRVTVRVNTGGRGSNKKK